MDAAERRLLEASVASAISDAAAAAGDGTGATIDGVLQRIGWPDMLVAEPIDAIAIVFETLGCKNAVASALDDVFSDALGIPPNPNVAVLFPSFASSEPPGRVDAEGVHALGLATARTATATSFVVVVRDGSNLSVVTLPAPDVDTSRIAGVDPTLGLHQVGAHRSDTAEPRVPLEPASWDRAIAAARRAIGHEMLGACWAMLDLARHHALDRVQFDRPIARFQAVRHRLADSLVAIEALAAALAVADETRDALAAALAKATAGRTARTVAAHCQQVLAGIGFTTDHHFHRFAKRTMVLDGLVGSADDLTAELGLGLLAARRVPVLVEL